MPNDMRVGIVSEQRTEDGRVRVDFNDRDGIQSFWLMALQSRTGQDKHWHQPEPGEHVACLLDEDGEDGVIMGALYSQRDPPPTIDPNIYRLQFADGGLIEYNRTTGVMRLKARTRIELTASCILANGKAVHRVGDRDSDGDVAVTGACNQ